MNSRRDIRGMIAVLLPVAFAACGGSPTSPSVPTRGLLDGTWRGTLTITRTGQLPVVGPTVWTFDASAGTSSLQYRTTMTAQNAWFAPTALATTTLVPPGLLPADVQTIGSYASPRGCQGSFDSYGQVDAAHFTASFHGVDCDFQLFTGSVDLSR